MKKVFKILFLLILLCSCQSTTVSNIPYANVYYHYKTIQPFLALTFDDGPNKNQTPKVLKILDKYNIKATFFVIGENIEWQKDTLKLVSDQGHEIENHFYNHININKVSKEEIKESICKTNELIYSITKKMPKYVRPPYGFVNNKLKEVCKELNMEIIIWTDDKDSKDWDKTPDNIIIKNITKKVNKGDIFLFHDGSKKYTNTLSAIDVVIPTLQNKGYKWVTLTTMLHN